MLAIAILAAFLVVIAALNIGDKLIAVISWCNDKDADILEPYLVHLAASLRERR